MRKIFLATLLFATVTLVGCVIRAEAAQAVAEVNGDLKISMLNIGNGDAILIQTGKQTILIDTARPQKNFALVNELKKFSVTKIDKLILTHPHLDHIGGASMLINPSKEELKKRPYLEKISVVEVYDNGVASASPLYKNYTAAAKSKGITLRSLKVGDTLDFGGGVKFKVLFPTAEFVTTLNGRTIDERDKIYSVNNSSLVGKLTYKNFSMMFTGDCEKASEEKILTNNKAADLKCDVLKSGHHGLKTSSTKNFVEAIKPACVLISAGDMKRNNRPYGFPHLEPLENYLAAGVDKEKIFCTRWNGTITVVSDGKNFSVTPERKEDWLDKWMEYKRNRKKK